MEKVIEFLQSCSVVDVESTSPVPTECEIIELAYGLYNDGNWNTFNQLYKPSIPIPPLSAEKHFITDAMVVDKPTWPAAYTEYQNFNVVTSNIKYFVAHNAQFDRTVITHNNERHNITDPVVANASNWICTLRLAEKLWKDDNALEAYRLSALWFILELYTTVDESVRLVPHQAETDILMAAKLLEYIVVEMVQRGIIDVNGDIGAQIIEFQNQPNIMTAWPWGKHKGTPIAEVPADYINWVMQNTNRLTEGHEDFDEDLAYSIQAAFGL